MTFIIKCIYMGFLIVLFIYYFHQQKQFALNQVNPLQFIGWLYPVPESSSIPSNAYFFIFFHQIDKTFIVSPVHSVNDFYILNETNIRHNSIIEFQNKQYQIILKGR